MEDRKAEMVRKVIELAAEQAGVAADTLTPASHFVDDLNFDSLDKVEFAMEVEDEFEMSVPDDRVDELKTIGDVVDFVAENEGKGSGPRKDSREGHEAEAS